MYLRMSVYYDQDILAKQSLKMTEDDQVEESTDCDLISQSPVITSDVSNEAPIRSRRDTPRVHSTKEHYKLKKIKKRKSQISNEVMDNNTILTDTPSTNTEMKKSGNGDLKIEIDEETKGKGQKIHERMSEEQIRTQERKMQRRGRRKKTKHGIEVYNNNANEINVEKKFQRTRATQARRSRTSKAKESANGQSGVLTRSSSVDVVYRTKPTIKATPPVWRQSDSTMNNSVPPNIPSYYNDHQSYNRSKGGIRAFFSRITGSLESILKFKRPSKRANSSKHASTYCRPNGPTPIPPELPKRPPNASQMGNIDNKCMPALPMHEYFKHSMYVEDNQPTTNEEPENFETVEPIAENDPIFIPKLPLTARTEYNFDEFNQPQNTDVPNTERSVTTPTHRNKKSSSLRRKLLTKECPQPPTGTPPSHRRRRVISTSSSASSFNCAKQTEHSQGFDTNGGKPSNSIPGNYIAIHSKTESNSSNASDNVFIDVKDNEGQCQTFAPKPLPRTCHSSTDMRRNTSFSSEIISKSVSLNNLEIGLREKSMREAESFEQIMSELDKLTTEIGRGKIAIRRRQSDSKVILGRKRRVLKSRQVPVRARRSPSRSNSENEDSNDAIGSTGKLKSMSLNNLSQVSHGSLQRKDSWASNVSLRLDKLIDNKGSREKINSFSSTDDASVTDSIKVLTSTRIRKPLKKPKLKQALIIDATNKVKQSTKLSSTTSPIVPTLTESVSFDDLQKDFEDFANKMREKKKRHHSRAIR